MDSSDTVITLRADRAVAGIAPRIGGSVASFHWQDGAQRENWLRGAAADDLDSATADRLGCFPLVPFSNRIRDGRFRFDGRDIRLPLNQWPQPHAEHGHGWQAAWDVVARDPDRLTLRYDHAAGDWPFTYRARQDIVLTPDELRLTLSLENRSAHPMPAGLGFHPYFPSTPHCRLSATVGAMWATDQEVMPTALVAADFRLATAGGLPLGEVALDNAFTGWGGTANIFWPERGAMLRLDAEPPFGFLVVYSPPDEPYFCVEPVSHCTDAFNLAAQGRGDTGMLVLEAGAHVCATMRLRPAFA